LPLPPLRVWLTSLQANEDGRMSEALKPCPFCKANGARFTPWEVGCSACGVFISPEKWNRRADLADLAGLPEELVRGLREALVADPESPHWTIMRETLTWHERQQKGEKE